MRHTLFLTTLALIAASIANAGEPDADSRSKPIPESPSPSPPDRVFVRAETVSRHAPNVVTRQILQDAKGNLWFASFSGVVRYDGRQYTNITNEAALAPTRAFSLLRDRHDNIWIGTLGAGVYRYDGARYEHITVRDGLRSDRVLSIMEERDGTIWFGHERGGATRLAGKQFTAFGAQDGFTDNDVSSMVQDGGGRLWFGTRDGLFFFDGKTFARLEQTRDLPTGGYIPTLIDRNGQLWFGGGSGLYHFDGKQLQRYSTDAGWALELRADGSIWFAGQTDLFRIDPASPPQTVPSPAWAPFEGKLWSAGDAKPAISKVGSLGTIAFNLFEDRDGALWIGTFGVARLEGERLRYLGDTAERQETLGRATSDEARRLAQRLGTE